jgi:tetratricopeptide (TPR) repeat protein
MRWRPSELEVDSISKLSNVAYVGAAMLFLFYLLLYSFACPRKELLISVGCELLFFACLAIWRVTRSKSLSSHAKTAVVAQLTEDIRPLAKARRFYHSTWLVVWIAVCILGSIDFVSLFLAYTGNYSQSACLYTNVPTMRLIGAHPAATAEILGGAFLNAGKLTQAENIYGVIRSVRNSVYGPESESSVGLLADYGDLYFLEKRYGDAAEFYEKSISVSKKTHGVTGYGRPLTGLANCYRELGQDEQAENLYKEAITMRSHLYGSRSDKVSATLKEYAQLLQKENRKDEANTVLARAASIDGLKKKEDNNPFAPLVPLFLSPLISNDSRYFANTRVLSNLEQRAGPTAVSLDADFTMDTCGSLSYGAIGNGV